MYKNLKFILENYGERIPLYFGPPEDKPKWLGWLKDLKHEVHEDGSVSVHEDVNIRDQSLIRILFKFEKVEGNVYCSYNKFKSLEGAPEKVEGDFYCTNNNLTSLKGSPKKVGETFNCSYNNLTSLEGAPVKVEGHFNCSNNNLTSLEGAPVAVGGNFYCYANKLTSLEGAPVKVEGNFYCSNNKLTSLDGAPETIGGYFTSDKFSDEDYRKFAKKRKYIEGKLDKDLNIDLDDFSS